jgi:hypothetical protein
MNLDSFDQKSKFNQTACELLIKNGLAAPSIHCSYYSCIQQMLFVIYSKLGYTKESFDKYLKQKSHNLGTHKKAIYLMKEYFRENRNEFEHGLYKNFQNDIANLKDLREQSDYYDILITNDKAHYAKDLSIRILNYLKKVKQYEN